MSRSTVFTFVLPVVMSVVLEWVVTPSGVAEQGSDWEINIREMVRPLLYELSFRFLGIFLLLAAVRFIFLTGASHTTEDFTVKR